MLLKLKHDMNKENWPRLQKVHVGYKKSESKIPKSKPHEVIETVQENLRLSIRGKIFHSV